MAESPTSTDPKPLYLDRLRLVDNGELASNRATKAFDPKTQQKVFVAVEPKTRNPKLTLLQSASHAHLNPIVEIIEGDIDFIVLSRELEALTLAQRIAEIGKKSPVDAVRMVLRVADAISHLHELGVSHGRIHPDNVFVGLIDLVEPCLVFGSQSPKVYLSPEHRTATDPVDTNDDTWATTALLYFMLTGAAPPEDGFDSLESIDTLLIRDVKLREVLFHGLAKSTDSRAKTLLSLKRELARWFIAHAAEESVPPGVVSQKPPPLPASIAPVPRASMGAKELLGSVSKNPEALRGTPSRAPAKPVWLRSLPLAIGAAVLGIGVAWGLSILRKGEATVIVKDKIVANSATGATAEGPIDLAEVPVTGKEQEQQAGDATASCVKGYLREGTLVKVPQLDTICTSGELPHVLGTLRQSFATSVGANIPNLPRFDTLGWYAVPALAGLRQSCCGDNVTPLKLPDLGDDCRDFAPAVDELARAISGSSPLDSAILKFQEAAVCAAKTGRAPGIAPAAPSPVSERAFRELFTTTNATPDAGTVVPANSAATPSPSPSANQP
jgi:hypothetical protein